MQSRLEFWKKFGWLLLAVIVCMFLMAVAWDFFTTTIDAHQSGDLEVFGLALLGVALYFRRKVVRWLYWGCVVMFWIGAILTGFALLACIGSWVVSFLTTPIGIKSSTDGGGYGGVFAAMLGTTTAAGVGRFAFGRAYRRTKRTELAA